MKIRPHSGHSQLQLLPMKALLGALLGLFAWTSFATPFEIHLPEEDRFFKSWETEILQDQSLSPNEQSLRAEFVGTLKRKHRQMSRSLSEKERLARTLKTLLEDINSKNETETNNQSNTTRLSRSLFLRNLDLAFHELPERGESLFLFIRAFTEFSTLSSPKSLEAFEKHRSYFNGQESTEARPLDLEKAGEVASMILNQRSQPLPEWSRVSEPNRLIKEYSESLHY